MRAVWNPWAGLVIGIMPLAAAAAVPDGCRPIADPGRIVHTARIILVGEIHGTREYPDFVARLACRALASGRAVTLALELPQEEQARLDAYLASSGSPAAATALTAGSRFWHEVRDGRASGAMLVLLEQARRWHEAGKPIRVIAIDKPRGAEGTRDEHMAAQVRQAAPGRLDALLIALTGNIHNQLGPAHLPGAADTPMGTLLRDLAPLSLGSESGRGEFFGCAPDCRVHDSDQRGPALAVPVITSAPDRGRGPYTHLVDLGRTSASAPAIDAMR